MKPLNALANLLEASFNVLPTDRHKALLYPCWGIHMQGKNLVQTVVTQIMPTH